MKSEKIEFQKHQNLAFIISNTWLSSSQTPGFRQHKYMCEIISLMRCRKAPNTLA
jgi:hypothetical protein